MRIIDRTPTRSPSSASHDPELAARLRLAIARMARRLRQEGGTGTEASATLMAALSTIERAGPLTPSALAEAERIQRPTAARVIGKLEAARLVTRTPDPSDRRVAQVAITREGRTLLKRVRTRRNQFLAKRLRTLQPDEQQTLAEATRILERLLEDAPR